MSTEESSGSLRRESSSSFMEVGEKRKNLRRIAAEVGNMAAELQSVRSRAAAQETALQEEAGRRQAAEANVTDLAKRLETMHSSLEESQSEAQSSASVAEQSLQELMDVTERLAEAEEITESSTAAAMSFRLQCEILSRDLEQRDSELHHQRTLVESLEQQLADLQNEIKLKATHKQLRYDVQDLTAQLELTMRRTCDSKECEFQKLLNEVSSQNIKHLEKRLLIKEDELVRLRHELDKQSAPEQELQKKIIQLEFCLGEAQRQIRKLEKMLEEQEHQSLRTQIWLHEATSSALSKTSFWDNFKLPGLISVSAIALVCMIKR